MSREARRGAKKERGELECGGGPATQLGWTTALQSDLAQEYLPPEPHSDKMNWSLEVIFFSSFSCVSMCGVCACL